MYYIKYQYMLMIIIVSIDWVFYVLEMILNYLLAFSYLTTTIALWTTYFSISWFMDKDEEFQR